MYCTFKFECSRCTKTVEYSAEKEREEVQTCGKCLAEDRFSGRDSTKTVDAPLGCYVRDGMSNKCNRGYK